jgi:hypothetical protein
MGARAVNPNVKQFHIRISKSKKVTVTHLDLPLQIQTANRLQLGFTPQVPLSPRRAQRAWLSGRNPMRHAFVIAKSKKESLSHLDLPLNPNSNPV